MPFAGIESSCPPISRVPYIKISFASGAMLWRRISGFGKRVMQPFAPAKNNQASSDPPAPETAQLTMQQTHPVISSGSSRAPAIQRGSHHISAEAETMSPRCMYKPLSSHPNYAIPKQHMKSGAPTFVERVIELATPIKIPPN
jgi:hypothetical protein